MDPLWESFEAAVHINTHLTPVEKFNYLNSVVEGTAQEAIAGLSLTAANYEQAVTTLKKHFGSKQKIINKHMDAMLNVGSVFSYTDVKGLRHLFDQVSSHVRSVQSCQGPRKLRSEMLDSYICSACRAVGSNLRVVRP